jgi:hypothetical protein
LAKPFDISKFRKDITKAIDGLSIGFNDPTDWISTGNYALNYRISGDFNKGIPLGKVTVFAGESGAGKSYICSGNIVKNAQEQGIFVVLIDTENALDEAWLHALGVDTSEDKLMRLSMSMIDDVAKTISEFMKELKGMDEADRPKVLFVVDSLGMRCMVRRYDTAHYNRSVFAPDIEDIGEWTKHDDALNKLSSVGELNACDGTSGGVLRSAFRISAQLDSVLFLLGQEASI